MFSSHRCIFPHARLINSICQEERSIRKRGRTATWLVRQWHRGLQISTEIKPGEPVVPALLAPTSNIVVHVRHRASAARSPSTRAIAINNLGDGSFAHPRPLPPSLKTCEVNFSTTVEIPYIFPCSRSRSGILYRKNSDLQFPPRLLRVPYHLGACLLCFKPASLATASGESASATSVKATKPLPCGRITSSRPAAKRVLTLRIGEARSPAST